MRCAFMLLVLLSCALPSCISQAASRDLPHPAVGAPDEQSVREAIAHEVQAAIHVSDFAGLSAMERDYRLTGARTPSGVWKLAMFHLEVQYLLTGGLEPTSGCVNSNQDFVERWLQAMPGDAAAIITDAALLERQAWCIRGVGSADSVSNDAWPKFRQIVAAASALFDAHKATASVDPEFYAISLLLARDEGMDRDAFRQLLDEAIARAPDYQETYFKAAWFYLPQWGGSYAELERFARYAVARSKGTDRRGMYARIYWSLDECGCHITRQSADWSMMQQSMQDVYEQYPDVWNGNYFKNLSCRLKKLDDGHRYIRALHPEAVNEASFAALFAACDNMSQLGG